MNWIAACMGLAGFTGEAQVPLESRVDSVTVFPNVALVKRAAQAPGGGSFVLFGLPWELDPDSVRVRCKGADVLGSQTRERVRAVASNERIEALRKALAEVEAQWTAANDERDIAVRTKSHLDALLSLETKSRADAIAKGDVNHDAWATRLELLSRELDQLRVTLRAASRRAEELERAMAERRAELARCEGGEGVRERDVYVDLGAATGAVQLEIEYLVAGAGWTPRYELRAASDARSVELGYRADVWQTTGEDWSDVALSLSTAQPQRGTRAPELTTSWLSLDEPRSWRSEDKLVAESVAAPAPTRGEEFEDFDTAVVKQGLSVRFDLPRRESIASRRESTSVLVGRAQLGLEPEYFATPALDSNVWLRGRATNTSPWTLLAGQAAVFFGADYLGTSSIADVQPGAELTLHLGPDPALQVERSLLSDLTEQPGLLGSRLRRTRQFRVRLENHGAAAVGPDGVARVIVREALPRSSDERLVVEVVEPKPAPSKEERFVQAREEQGVSTWVLGVPRGGQSVLEYGLRLSWPKELEVVQP